MFVAGGVLTRLKRMPWSSSGASSFCAVTYIKHGGGNDADEDQQGDRTVVERPAKPPLIAMLQTLEGCDRETSRSRRREISA